MHERVSEVPEGFRKHVKFREEVDIPKLEALLKDSTTWSWGLRTLNAVSALGKHGTTMHRPYSSVA